MAKIKQDFHGFYFIYNGSVWRPILPKNKINEAIARNIFPNHGNEDLLDIVVKPKIDHDCVIFALHEKKFMWYDHGSKPTGIKSETCFRDFEKEDSFVKELIAKGISPREAYLKLYQQLI